VQDAGAEGGGGGQLEGYLGAFGEQPLAVADDDGVDEQVQFVDEALFEEPADEGGAAGGAEVVVLLELGQPALTSPLIRVEFSQARVGEGGGHDVLPEAARAIEHVGRYVTATNQGATRGVP
jgi:hypothetical protein